MNDRVRRLRQRSLDTHPSVSIERAVLLTDFYRENIGRYPQVVLRARAFHHLCANKTIFIGDDELIVGERGHAPKATPTYPEITCHSCEDLRILDSRSMTSYSVDTQDIERYERDVIPFWKGRSLRDRIFDLLPDEWHEAFAAGVFTEFMEQRAAGHTTLDGKFYGKGIEDFQADIDLFAGGRGGGEHQLLLDLQCAGTGQPGAEHAAHDAVKKHTMGHRVSEFGPCRELGVHVDRVVVPAEGGKTV